MKLIPISNNVLINPECISCVEQIIERDKIVLYIWCDGRKHEYMYEEKIPIGEFLNILKQDSEKEQHFAG
jgi:hypothetical protein